VRQRLASEKLSEPLPHETVGIKRFHGAPGSGGRITHEDHRPRFFTRTRGLTPSHESP
jgi:hypothetical protein